MSMFVIINIDSAGSWKKARSPMQTSIVLDFHEFLRLRDVT